MKISVKRAILAVPFLVVMGLAGCSTVDVVTNPASTFSPNSRITVVVDADSIGVKGKLEHLLLARGFSVVSDAVAGRKTQTDAEASWSSDTATGSLATGDVVEYQSAYILRVYYRAYWNVFYWSFKSFNATVVDLRTGDVAASVNLSGDRRVKDVLARFVNAL